MDIATGRVIRALSDPSGVAADTFHIAAFNGNDTRLAVSYGAVSYIWDITA